MRPQATFSFFIFLQLFHFFTLLVAPSSSSLLPPRPSFLLVPPSSLFLFLPRPALSQSLRIHKRPFFIEFDESVTDQPTDQRTDGRTNPYRDAIAAFKKAVSRNHMHHDFGLYAFCAQSDDPIIQSSASFLFEVHINHRSMKYQGVQSVTYGKGRQGRQLTSLMSDCK